jgi:hypothetical protein
MGDSGHDMDPTFYRSPADAISAPPEKLVGFHNVVVLVDLRCHGWAGDGHAVR